MNLANRNRQVFLTYLLTEGFPQNVAEFASSKLGIRNNLPMSRFGLVYNVLGFEADESIKLIENPSRWCIIDLLNKYY